MQSVVFDLPLALELGGALPSVTVAYETYGTLSPQRDNAILICHALSGDSHVARHDADDTAGWWDVAVGPGRVIDTNRYFVICSNVLGGCSGTTGPNSIDPATAKPWGAQFPQITLADMVRVQRRLIDHLGIDVLEAVIGGSLGGHQAMTWAMTFPNRLRRCAILASSPRLTSQALAFDIVGRNAILRDPHFYEGQYYQHESGPAVGLALARMLGHITYLSREAMTSKFDPDRTAPRDVATEFEKQYSVGSYLAYQGSRFVDRFDANSYLTITRAMDRFDLGESPAKLAQSLASATCRWLVLSFSSDWLFPPEQSRQIVSALVRTNQPVSYCNIITDYGHDAFLLPHDLPVYGRMLSAFLTAAPHAVAADTSQKSPGSIFNRLDYSLILELIEPESSVLDLGCGQGELLTLLRQRSASSRLLGIELNQPALMTAVEQGHDVIQADLEQPLGGIEDQQFDVVVLSQTLQTIDQIERVLREMLRVGQRCIVSLPNFAYHRLRMMFYEQGRSPKSTGIYSYEWHDTPNRRYASILDFHDFCASRGIRIEREIYLDTETNRRIEENPNFNADLAIYVISS